MPESSHGTCGCGRPADKTSSGMPECWRCWNRRKLDLPAAAHWAKQTPLLHEAVTEWLARVDPWDLTKFWPAAGLTRGDIKQLNAAFKTVFDLTGKIGEYSQVMVDTGYGDMPNEAQLAERDKEDLLP